MELFKIDYQGQPLRLEGSMAGWQQLFWNNQLVSAKPASANPNGLYVHEFDISLVPDGDGEPKVQHCRIQAKVSWQPFEVVYQLFVDDALVTGGKRSYKDIEEQVPFQMPKAKRSFKLFGLTAAAFKLVKSAKVIKLTLAASSLALYSWIFSLTFALALLTSLMFHELGRGYALRYFGITSKGLYLVPFYGGFAMRDEQVTTRWQAVVIALAGPSFGLLMTLFYMFAYGLTYNLLFAALASFSALLSLFNLLPVLPLAGGHVLKNVSFSMTSKPAALFCFIVLGAGVVVTLKADLLLFTALLVAGAAEIMVAYRGRLSCQLIPLDRYGQIFSLAWYCLLVFCLIWVVWCFAGMGDDVLSLPLELLQI